jgi:hypothetical protein
MLAGFAGLLALPLLIGYLPVILDTGGWDAYFAVIRSESGKHILRFGEWASNPLMEFIVTTGSIADFLKEGLGMGRWVLLALLIPITGEVGCAPRRVIGLLPLGVAGFAALHWGADPAVRAAGILAFVFSVAYLVPTSITAAGLATRRLFALWVAPGLILFVLVFVNYVGVFIVFLPALVLLEAWAIERAAVFMSLQTIREQDKRSEDTAASVVKGPDVRVERLVAWLLIALMAMHEVGVFTEGVFGGPGRIDPNKAIGELGQENWRAIVARDTWLEDVISAVNKAPYRASELIVLGGVDDYRHWTYYIPEARTIWTKYLLYYPVRRGRGAWVSQWRRQEMVQPEVTDGGDPNGPLTARIPIGGAKGIVVFGDELERFEGSAVVTGLGGEVGGSGEAVCYFIPTGEKVAIAFREGVWWLE